MVRRRADQACAARRQQQRCVDAADRLDVLCVRSGPGATHWRSRLCTGLPTDINGCARDLRRCGDAVPGRATVAVRHSQVVRARRWTDGRNRLPQSELRLRRASGQLRPAGDHGLRHDLGRSSRYVWRDGAILLPGRATLAARPSSHHGFEYFSRTNGTGSVRGRCVIRGTTSKVACRTITPAGCFSRTDIPTLYPSDRAGSGSPISSVWITRGVDGGGYPRERTPPV